MGRTHNRLLVAAVILAAVAVPLFLQKPYTVHLITVALIYAAMAQSWNIVGGYAGQLSFGHATFFGLGAYTAHLLNIHFGVPTILGALIGGLVGVPVSVIVGLPTFRLRGPFYALGTMAIAEVWRAVASSWRSLTGGMAGITVPNRGFSVWYLQFSSKLPSYYLFLGFLMLVTGVAWWIERSSFGLKLACLRDDEEAANSVGIDTLRYKLLAGMISAFFTGVIGALYGNYVYVIDPVLVFGPEISVIMLSYAVMGGTHTYWGPIVGALAIAPLSLYLNSVISTRGWYGVNIFVLGAIITAVTMFVPGGLVGLLQAAGRRLSRARKGGVTSGAHSAR